MISKLGYYWAYLKAVLRGFSPTAIDSYGNYLRDRFKVFSRLVVQRAGCWSYLGDGDFTIITKLGGPPIPFKPQVIMYCVTHSLSPFSLKQDVVNTCSDPACVNPDHLKLVDKDTQ